MAQLRCQQATKGTEAGAVGSEAGTTATEEMTRCNREDWAVGVEMMNGETVKARSRLLGIAPDSRSHLANDASFAMRRTCSWHACPKSPVA